MPRACSLHVVAAAEGPQIGDFIRPQLAALDVVNMALIQFEGSVTANTLPVVTLPHVAPQLPPNFTRGR